MIKQIYTKLNIFNKHNAKWINLIYYVCFTVIIGFGLFGVTAFRVFPEVSIIRTRVTAVALFIVVILFLLSLFEDESKWQKLLRLLLIISVGLQYLVGGKDATMVILALLVATSLNKSAKVLLRIFFWLGLGIVLLAYFASGEGYIAYAINGESRHAFGFIYYSNFADAILYLYIAYRVLRGKRMYLYDYALSIGLIYFTWRYTHARTVLICMVFFFVLCIVYDIISLIQEKIHMPSFKLLHKLTVPFYTYMVVISLIAELIWKYVGGSRLNESAAGLDSMIARLNLGLEALTKYTPNLFGRVVPFMGGSIMADSSVSYFVIDNSYLKLLVVNGIVFTTLLMIALTVAIKRFIKEKDFYLIFALVTVGIGGLAEDYTIVYYYNVFMLAIFACTSTLNRSNDKNHTKLNIYEENI